MSAASGFSEHRRQAVHILMGACALLLRYLTWWEAAIVAALAVAFNWSVLPKIGGTTLYRPADHARGFPLGILLYPIVVLALILVFRERLDIAAGAWGILAAGDGMATIVGTRVGGLRVPWNRDKTIAGSIALFVFGGAAGALLCWWCRPVVMPPPYSWFSLTAPFVAALAAAAVETLPIRLDDNISVSAAAGAVLWMLSLMSNDMLAAAAGQSLQATPAAVIVNALVAWAGYRARTVSISGMVGGAIIGIVIFIAAGWRGWLLLFVTFAAATISSRIGLKRKTLLGIAEERGGRRGAGNAIANTGIAAAAAVMSITTYAEGSALVGFAAALAAGGSDTIASEIGKAWGRHAYLVPTFRGVPPGTSGAVSIEGTAAGLIGALALALVAVGLDILPRPAVLAVVIAATIGAFAESALAATLEARGIVNNDVLNFVNTAIAAWTAVLLASALA